MSRSFSSATSSVRHRNTHRHNPNSSGSFLGELDIEQISIDILFGILRDWTFKSAGHPGPWTDHASNPLEKVLSVLEAQADLAADDSEIDDGGEQAVAVARSSRKTKTPGGINDGIENASRLQQGRGLRSVLQRGPSSSAEPIRLLSPRKRRRVLEVGSFEQGLLNGNRRGGRVNSLNSSSANSRVNASAYSRVARNSCTNAQHQATCSSDHRIHPSRLPLASLPGCASVLFLSQLVPRHFSKQRRFQVLEILHYEAPYIPTCIMDIPGKASRFFFGSLAENLPSLADPSDRRLSTMQEPSVKSTNPSLRLPPEILGRVAGYLDRRDVQVLLLTCRNFNEKLGPLYFEHVVVPFTCDTFVGVRLGLARLLHKEADLDMFRTWGKHVRKFGFAIELNKSELIKPPKKTTTETIDTFWQAAVPWATQDYHLHPRLAKTEAAAEHEGLMAKACSSLINITELALTTDRGLGYMEGFDISDRARLCKEKVEVFGRRYAQSREEQTRAWLSVDRHALQQLSYPDNVVFMRYLQCLRYVPRAEDSFADVVAYYMMTSPPDYLANADADQINDHVLAVMGRAGVLRPEMDPNEWKDVETLLRAAQEIARHPTVRSLLQHSTPIREQISIGHPVRRYGRLMIAPGYTQEGGPPTGRIFPSNNSVNKRNPAAWRPWLYSNIPADLGPYPIEAFKIGLNQNIEGLNRDLMARIFSISEESGPALIFGGRDLNTDPDYTTIGEEDFSQQPLKPSTLTLAQAQWLAETDWVQQAFLTSYVSSVIKNKPNFDNVRAFTLAKVSSGHLGRLHDVEFWDSLCGVEKITIMVSAEWRAINRGHGHEFHSVSVAPSCAVTDFECLLGILATREGVKSLKIGYTDGGEHAVGLFGRNQHLLPAPIVSERRDANALSLPHVRHLTFVNCWFVPEVLKTFIADASTHALQTLRFESVSLLVAGGRSATYGIPWPPNLPEEFVETLHNQMRPPFYLGFGVPQPGRTTVATSQDYKPTMPYPKTIGHHGAGASQAEDSHVYHSTWLDIINYCISIAAQRAVEAASKDEGTSKKQQHTKLTLGRIEFNSCGYAKLPFQTLHQFLTVVPVPASASRLADRKEAISPFMMKSDDPFLGTIHPEIPEPERTILTSGFGMRMGWNDKRKRLEPLEDGQRVGGTGRFSGALTES
ncbi:hypothetical protein MMC13_007800 [Lambiella insularis]|nr:hypothetical protein [Lambiella insularis]